MDQKMSISESEIPFAFINIEDLLKIVQNNTLKNLKNLRES